MAGCAGSELKGCAPRQAEWYDPDLLAAVEGDDDLGFDYVENGGSSIPFNGTVSVTDNVRLVSIEFGPFMRGFHLNPAGFVSFGNSFKDVAPDEVSRMAHAFVTNVSALSVPAQDAWVQAFLANRTVRTTTVYIDGTSAPGTAVSYGAILPGPYRSDALFAEVMQAGPEARIGSDPGMFFRGNDTWRFAFAIPYWEFTFGWESGVGLDRTGHVRYGSEAGPEEAPMFGSDAQFKRIIRNEFHQAELPEPNLDDAEIFEPQCDASLRFED